MTASKEFFKDGFTEMTGNQVKVLHVHVCILKYRVG